MTTAWLIDGNPDAHLDPVNRGLAYGDGLFETIAAPGGRPRHLERHYARLRASCERLGMPSPSRESIDADIVKLVTADTDCIVKIIVTRSGGGRGYRPPDQAAISRMTGIFPWPDYPPARSKQGIHAIRCAMRLGENPLLAGMKHLCRLEQVLAQREVAATPADEGLLFSSSGLLVSGSMSNVFIVSAGRLQTPRLDRCGVAGIMRGLILEAANTHSLDVEVGDFDAQALAAAQEIFVCNSVFGIWPVSVLDGVAIGVGKLTQSVQEFPELQLR